MKVMYHRGRALLLATAVGTVFADGAYAREAAADTAYVPFTVVNVGATVTAVPASGTAADVSQVQMSVSANTETTLKIPLGDGTGVLVGGQRQLNVPAMIGNRGGAISLNLPAQTYREAEISVYTVDGKRVLRKKISALSAVNNISRSNAAPGVYLLTVKGMDGAAFASRLTHGGGNMVVSVSFGGESRSSTLQLAKKASAGDWTITVSAAVDGYEDSVYSLTPMVGANTPQNITLRPKVVTPPGGGDVEFVTIDGRKWMSKNLNIETANSYCYGNSPDSCAKYGRLYTWAAAMTACPSGWHLPTRDEWGALAIAAGGTGTYGTGGTAGRKLKSTTGWNYYSDSYYGTDEFGFTALPGGFRFSGGGFYGAGDDGDWWMATEYGGGYAYGRYMSYGNDSVDEDGRGRGYAFSVRCVMD